MSKVTNTTEKQTIELIDTDRTGSDVVYLYATPELSEDDPAHKIRISEQELIQFCIDFDKGEDEYSAMQLLHDAWEDIKDMYWAEVLEQKLLTGYQEAMVYINAYTHQAKKPMPAAQVNALYVHIERTFGVQIGRRAA